MQNSAPGSGSDGARVTLGPPGDANVTRGPRRSVRIERGRTFCPQRRGNAPEPRVPATEHQPGGLNSDQWRDLQECASRLERSLQSEQDPGDLRRFLPPAGSPHRRAVLHELIKTCLEHLFRGHRGCLLEEFLRCYPELGRPEDLPPELVFEEYRVRWKFGDRPALEEYRTRFPVQFENLRRMARQEQWPSTHPMSPVTNDTLTPLTGPPTVGPPATASGTPPPAIPVKPKLSGTSTMLLEEGYELFERIGRGEFGEVHRALAPGGVNVAIKRIFRPMSDEACQRELRALKRVSEIRHPYLLQTHNFQAVAEHLVIVMELADGSIADRFKECRAAGLPGIPADELLRYFEEAAEALDFLRKEKLAHRDIKPANLLHLKGHAKVADFGIARTQEASIDQTLNFAGTPAYMAPEVWRKEISVHSDQYSFAATWYEMRTGRRIFTGLSVPEVALQHMNAQPELPDVSEAERQVLLRALDKEPDKRFPSCTEFVRALKRAIEPPAPKPAPGPASRGLKVLAVVLAGITLGMLAVVAIVYRQQTQQLESQPPPVREETEATKKVQWIPRDWQPANSDENTETDKNGDQFYRRVKRSFGSQEVVAILVPQNSTADPRTFYIMQDKVWNDLYQLFWDDPKGKDLLKEHSSCPGCPVLVKAAEEWKLGATPSGTFKDQSLGVDGPRGRAPVYRVTATEAESFAEWMGGRLPTVKQYYRAAGSSGSQPPGVLSGDPHDLAIGLRTGPWTVDQWGRDEIPLGIHQLVTNGKEFTRSMLDGDDELPLGQMTAVRYVRIVGRSYANTDLPTVANLTALDSIKCTDNSPEVSFRVVLERP